MFLRLATWLSSFQRARSSRRHTVEPCSELETLEVRQLLVADPTGLWNVVADHNVGEGTLNFQLQGNRLTGTVSFPGFGLDNATMTGNLVGNSMKAKTKQALFNGSTIVKSKLKLNFTSDNTFEAVTKSKVKGEAGKHVVNIAGTRAM